MIDLKSVVRPSILDLTAYSSARSLVTEASVFLDANESPEAPRLGTTLSWETNLNRYPSPQPKALLEKFSRYYGVPKENILIGRGSDEAIDILTRALCEPKTDAVLITPPTYGMYQVAADIQNTPVVRVPLQLKNGEWELDVEGILAQLKNNVKMIYICSPNNPTGTVFALSQIKQLLQNLPSSTILVLDEAYGEFAEQAAGIPLLKEFSNLVVLRTLSKAWGLAGLRCGVLLGHAALIDILRKVLAPYPLPQPVIELAQTALESDGENQMHARVKNQTIEREKLKTELLKLPQVVQIFPSQTNFLLVEFSNSPSAMAAAARNGVVLRHRSSEIKNTVRITVGSPKENALLLKSLKNMETP